MVAEVGGNAACFQHMIDEKKLSHCKNLYIENAGRNHLLIQSEMRKAGWRTFSVRCLYRSNGRPGWIERFGWKSLIEDKGRNTTGRECVTMNIGQRGTLATARVAAAS